MTTLLQFEPLRSPADKGWDEALALYRDSFPPFEQRSDLQYRLVLDDPLFRAETVWTEGRLAAILYYWEYDGCSFIEHLAVSPAMRGRKIGSDILEAFCRGRRVLLEIDPPVDDISRRRERFYERMGFVRNPHEWLHPGYAPSHAHPLVLMSYPDPLTDEEVRRFIAFAYERVLRYSDQPELTPPQTLSKEDDPERQERDGRPQHHA